MRMIERDALPKVATRLVERLTQDPGAALDIGAEVVPQRPVGRLARRRQWSAILPSQVSLTCIGPMSTVPFAFWLTAPEPPGFDADQKRQHAGGNMMNLRRRFQAALDHRLIGARGGSARN